MKLKLPWNTPPGALVRPIEILKIAVCAGLLGGLGQAFAQDINRLYLKRIVTMGSNRYWMAPLMTALALLVPAGIMAVGIWRRPNWGRQSMVSAILIFFAVLNITLIVPRIDVIAKLLLAAGIAAVAVRRISRNGARFQAVVNRTTPWIVGSIPAIAIVIFGWTRVAERRARAQLPAAPPGAPNVLLMVLDAVRGTEFSLYGYGRPTTPSFTKMASEGLRFDRALATTAWTLPSHASMFTGRLPHELSADWQVPLDDRYPTLAEVLRSRGYATAGFVANLSYTSTLHGLSRGFDHYEDYLLSPGELFMSSKIVQRVFNTGWLRRRIGYYDFWGRKSAAEADRELLDWLPTAAPRPFFVFMNFFDAHLPRIPPPEFDERFRSSNVSRRLGEMVQELHQAEFLRNLPMTPEQRQREVDAYDATIAYIDAQVGQMLDSLAARGLLDNTVVILTGDHGEHFGEHGEVQHGHTLDRAVLDEPLIIRFPPKIPAGTVVKVPVSLRDLPATILDLVGMRDQQILPGRSLVGCWLPDAGPCAPSPVYSELRWEENGTRLWSLHLDGKQYIRWADTLEVIYDWDHDPEERVDLTKTADGPALLAARRPILDSMISSHSTVPR